MSYEQGDSLRELERLTNENAELCECLDELCHLIDGIGDGSYEPDSFTTGPARELLHKIGYTRKDDA